MLFPTSVHTCIPFFIIEVQAKIPPNLNVIEETFKKFTNTLAQEEHKAKI